MKKILSIILVLSMVLAFVACAPSEPTEPETPEPEVTDPAGEEPVDTDPAGEEPVGDDKTYALIVKSAGNPFMQKMIDGFTEVIDAEGGEVVIKQPETATAEHQITMINELVAQGVDSICIAANDVDALQPALTAAMDAGIKVSGLDSATNADSRQLFINQAGTVEIGVALSEAAHDIMGGEGEFAILSATSQATNQNAWIEAMADTMANDDMYANMTRVEVAYGDDEYQKSVDQTQALLRNYPDLKLIVAPTTVGIMAAAKVLEDQGVTDTVKLTGLGLPSEMADYVGDGDDFSTPYFYLWNPIDLGRLGAYASIALVDGSTTGAAGETFGAGDLGEYEIVEAADGGTEVILGPPFKFTPENIDEWKDVY